VFPINLVPVFHKFIHVLASNSVGIWAFWDYRYSFIRVVNVIFKVEFFLYIFYKGLLLLFALDLHEIIMNWIANHLCLQLIIIVILIVKYVTGMIKLYQFWI